MTGEAPARFIVPTSTGAFAAFVRAYGVPAGLPTRVVPDVERLGRLAAEHGIELLGPPGMLPSQLSAAVQGAGRGAARAGAPAAARRR